MRHTSKYFYGHEVSDYGKKNKRVDYRTFAQAFDAVLNNNIISELSNKGYYFDEYNTEYYEDNDGNIYTYDEAEEKREEISERLEEIDEKLDELQENEEANEAEIKALEEEAAALEENSEALEDAHYKDIFQYYIVSDNAEELLKEAGEAYFYNAELDLLVWGVDHWGTSWDYVLTNIALDIDEE